MAGLTRADLIYYNQDPRIGLGTTLNREINTFLAESKIISQARCALPLPSSEGDVSLTITHFLAGAVLWRNLSSWVAPDKKVGSYHSESCSRYEIIRPKTFQCRIEIDEIKPDFTKMAFRFQSRVLLPLFKQSVRHKSQRKNLGKHPLIAKNLDQRLQEINWKDPNVYYKLNIGFAVKRPGRRERIEEHVGLLKENKKNDALRQLAEEHKIEIPLEEVEKIWTQTVAPVQLKDIAEYYGIFDHLFGDAYFYPVVRLDVAYSDSVPIYRGNLVKPSEANKAPEVRFDSKPDSLWTLIMTTPDGNPSETEETLHWFLGNIKGSDLKTGQTICDYMQPLPLRGLGFLRYVFVLYKQTGPLDYSAVTDACKESERGFSTKEFYREFQDEITPAGMAFYTSDWDNSVSHFYSEHYQMDDPRFCYDFPDHYYKKQTWFPLKQPFNLYLDRYRDQKQIAKELLIKKLSRTDPFDQSPPGSKKLKFPCGVPYKRGTPSWLKNEQLKERLGWARYGDYK